MAAAAAAFCSWSSSEVRGSHPLVSGCGMTSVTSCRWECWGRSSGCIGQPGTNSCWRPPLCQHMHVITVWLSESRFYDPSIKQVMQSYWHEDPCLSPILTVTHQSLTFRLQGQCMPMACHGLVLTAQAIFSCPRLSHRKTHKIADAIPYYMGAVMAWLKHSKDTWVHDNALFLGDILA